MDEPLGHDLRRLRLAQNLSLGEASRRSGLSKTSIGDWESGRYAPPGASLARLLDHLNPTPGDRSRLLAAFDPTYARRELIEDPVGPPPDLGQILRALRARSGLTQAEAARRLGLSQSAFAKWESGDTLPTPDAVARALPLLGASAEEAAALARFGVGERREAVTLDQYEWRVMTVGATPLHLRELAIIGLESDLWWRTTREPAAARLLCAAMSIRTHHALFFGDRVQVAALAPRPIRLAGTLGTFEEAAGAVYALGWHRQRSGRDPVSAARMFGRWSRRLGSKRYATWFETAEALAIVRSGDEDEGIDRLRLIERRSVAEGEPAYIRYVRNDLMDAYLESGQPELANEVLDDIGPHVDPHNRLRVYLALGREPDPAEVARLRDEAATGDLVRRWRWARLERELRRRDRRN